MSENAFEKRRKIHGRLRKGGTLPSVIGGSNGWMNLLLLLLLLSLLALVLLPQDLLLRENALYSPQHAARLVPRCCLHLRSGSQRAPAADEAQWRR